MIAVIEHLKLAVFAPRLGTSPNLEGVYSEDFDHWATRNDGTGTAYNIELNPSGGSIIIGN